MTNEELEQYAVYYEGKSISVVNPWLLKRQKVEHNLEAIKALHLERIELWEALKKETDKAIMRTYAPRITEIEFALQRLWHFPEDAQFHRFFEAPQCLCPKLDNSDDYPYRQHVNMSCPVHGND